MLALESQSAMFHWENPITMGIGLIGSQHSINLNEGGLWLHSCDHIIWCVSEAAVLLKVAQTKKMLLGPLEAKLPEMSWPPKLSRKAPPISRSAEKLYLLVPNTREVSWGTKPSCSFHSGARRLPRVLNPTCHCPFAGTPLRFSWWISSRTSACVPSCLESCQGIQLACSIQWEGWKSPLSFYSSQKSSILLWPSGDAASDLNALQKTHEHCHGTCHAAPWSSSGVMDSESRATKRCLQCTQSSAGRILHVYIYHMLIGFTYLHHHGLRALQSTYPTTSREDQ